MDEGEEYEGEAGRVERLGAMLRWKGLMMGNLRVDDRVEMGRARLRNLLDF